MKTTIELHDTFNRHIIKTATGSNDTTEDRLRDAVNHATARGDTHESGRLGNLMGPLRRGRVPVTVVEASIRGEMARF